MSTVMFQATCRIALQGLVSETAGIESAAIVTGDGFEVASVMRGPTPVEKLAAMVSSLLALSEALVAEVGKHRCNDVIVDTDNGCIVVLRVPARGHDLLLCALCGDAATLGSVLFAARESARALARRLLPAA